MASKTEADQQRQIAEAQKTEKEHQQQLTLAHQLVAQATVERDRLGNSWRLNGLLVAESLRRDPLVPETVALAYRILEPSAHLVAWAEHDAPVHTVALSPDGHWMASGNGGGDSPGWGELRIWNATSGQEAFRVRLDVEAPSVAFSPDSSRVAVGGQPTTLIWDVLTGQELVQMESAESVSGIAFSGDGKYLIGYERIESVLTDSAAKKTESQ